MTVRLDPRAGTDIPLRHRDPMRERWFPSWRSALMHAIMRSQATRTAWKVHRDPEWSAWIARPRS